MGELTIHLDTVSKPDEFIPYYMEDYKILKPLTNNKSGFSRWGFCEKNSEIYFIKEFLTPVYPDDNVELSEELRQSKINQCVEWFEKRKDLYKRLILSQTGNLITPVKFFKYKSHFYIITKKVPENTVDFETIKYVETEQKVMIMKVLANCFIKLAENKVVHADVKPDNLMFKKTTGDFFTIKVIDFDASYLEGNPPPADELQGDLVYLAPETFLAMCEEDIKLTSKADVFALGIIFHQILCGEIPSFSDEYDYLYEAVLNDDDIILNPDLLPLHRKIISGMLIKDAEKRYSMKRVMEELSFKNINQMSKSDITDSGTNRKSRWRIPDNFD